MHKREDDDLSGKDLYAMAKLDGAAMASKLDMVDMDIPLDMHSTMLSDQVGEGQLCGGQLCGAYELKKLMPLLFFFFFGFGFCCSGTCTVSSALKRVPIP